ncbi:MAG: SusC/RagA family TonB-linked outer membrane protein [Prolixibacteraceae bacterium]
MKKQSHNTMCDTLSDFNLKKKMIALLIFVFGLNVSASYAQKNITLNFDKVKVSRLLAIIESQTDYRFTYKIKDVDLDREVKINSENESIVVVLNKLFKDSKTDYRIFGDQIFLTERQAAKDAKTDKTTETVPLLIPVKGTVTEGDTKAPVPGANIVVKGTFNGATTNMDGEFSIEVPVDAVLEVSFIGFSKQKIYVNGRTQIDIVLETESESMEEVIIVGYGIQKKESVVGSIVQMSGDKLMQSGGVSTVGQALTGRLPGVTTISSTGRPGDESPQIFIRGKSTWNGTGQPLILIDGIERSMNDINMGDVESLSVLKDASATAVFGVKGANGVILITTKRGKKGKAQLSVSASSTVKTLSRIPEKYNSYNSLAAVNDAIERTVSVQEENWKDYTPISIMEKYRNPADELERQIYPDVDWVDVTQKDFAMDHRLSLSVSGGTEFAKYFGALTYQHVGDIFDGGSFDNGRNYEADFDYDRFNYRSNVDFDITPTTRFSINLSGYYGIQKSNDAEPQLLYSSIYTMAPSLYYPIFDDGTYGRGPFEQWEVTNPAMLLSAKGSIQNHRVQVNSDFVLDQKLDFLLDGLSFKGSLSYDNNFIGDAGIRENVPSSVDNLIYKIYDQNGNEQIVSPDGVNQFDFVIVPWKRDPLTIQDWNTSRRLFYQLSLNYNKKFNESHTVGLLALMNREEYAIGNMFPRYREDWVARLTYNFRSKYFVDINGAYNGSEKFGPGYRFELFPSIALGWMISNEAFMGGMDWLNKLKVRGSYGVVGDDNVGSRWAYVSQWSSGGSAYMNNSNPYGEKSPYTYYKESVIGNPNLRWETAKKANVGFELSVLENTFTMDLDLFKEDRYDIIVAGEDRSVPSFLGFKPADANLGETTVKGVELALNFKHQIDRNWDVSSSFSYTYAKDEILFKEDPELREAYQKSEGFPIGQPRSIIRGDLMTTWDDIYGSTPEESNQSQRRPGYYDEIDFNTDGIVNGDDNAPYGYPVRPQNSYNFTLGAGFKELSFMVQFYGVYNATKQYWDRTFSGDIPLFFAMKANYWSVDNPSGTEVLPSWGGVGVSTDSYRQWYDASFLKLKNVELAYNFKLKGGSQYRVYISGNDLAFWSALPDDRQDNVRDDITNVSNDGVSRGNYPSFKRFNIGVNINF